MKNTTFVILVALIIVVIGIGIYATSDFSLNAKNDVSSDNPDSKIKESNSVGSGVQVRINYPGEWSGEIESFNGNITYEGNAKVYNGDYEKKYVNGKGPKIFQIVDSPTELTVSVRKSDEGSEKLAVEILNEGKVVKTNETSEKGGYALLKYSFKNSNTK